eukprot:11152283-Lingulodinium_polyedra.AAC.1
MSAAGSRGLSPRRRPSSRSPGPRPAPRGPFPPGFTICGGRGACWRAAGAPAPPPGRDGRRWRTPPA